MGLPRVPLILAAIVASLASASKASAATCPYARVVPTADGTSYLARIFDDQPYAGPVDVTLYTAQDAYATHIPVVTAHMPDHDGYRSSTLRFARPGTAPFEAAVFTFPRPAPPSAGASASPAAASASPPAAKVGCTARLVFDPKNSDVSMKPALDEFDPSLASITLLKVIASTGTLTCENRYRDARIDGRPVQPQYPTIAREQGATGSVLVRVALNADGSVASASIYRSSGFGSLDQSALSAAAQSKYLPEVFRCEPVPGAYIYNATFTAR